MSRVHSPGHADSKSGGGTRTQPSLPVAGTGAWTHAVEMGGTEAYKIQWFVNVSEQEQNRIPKTQLAGAGKAARWPGLQCALQYPGLF